MTTSSAPVPTSPANQRPPLLNVDGIGISFGGLKAVQQF